MGTALDFLSYAGFKDCKQAWVCWKGKFKYLFSKKKLKESREIKCSHAEFMHKTSCTGDASAGYIVNTARIYVIEVKNWVMQSVF